MEKPPYILREITDFSIGQVKPYAPTLKEIKQLTLEIGSKLLPEKRSLVLMKPFPPLGRLGKDLERLASLDPEQIDSIWVFRETDGHPWPRIEIRGKAPDESIVLTIRCNAIEGVPAWAQTYS